MGRFKYLVDSLAAMEGFKAKYRILQGVALQYCAPNQILTDREVGEVVILMIAFLEGGMTLPMGRVTRDYLINHRLTPYQCTPNLFKVHLYECHKLADAGYYLKSQSDIVKLISCLPKSNKGMKDDYLLVSGEWHDGLHCPTRVGHPGGVH